MLQYLKLKVGVYVTVCRDTETGHHCNDNAISDVASVTSPMTPSHVDFSSIQTQLSRLTLDYFNHSSATTNN